MRLSTILILPIQFSGGLSFFAYRHFSWNRPRTLTDKFSNDESTGYIDDTAFRVSIALLFFRSNSTSLCHLLMLCFIIIVMFNYVPQGYKVGCHFFNIYRIVLFFWSCSDPNTFPLYYLLPWGLHKVKWYTNMYCNIK